MVIRCDLICVIYLSHEFGIPSVRDVILADISMEPVTEVQISVIQRQQNIRNQA